MASTYENDLRLEEMATGENSGSWGTKTNTNLELVADAFSYGTETIADADTAITIADGAADAARSLALKINSSEDLTTTRVVTLGPNTTSKVWIIENNTSGGQTLTISAGSGSNITLANGTTKIIATDGIGAGSNVVELTQDIAIADLSVDGILSLPDGTNSAPSLTNTGDTNTGLYFPAADEVGITVGGTQVFKADSTGANVTGILVSDGLTVDGTGTAVTLQSNNSGGTALNILQFKDTDTSLANTQSTGNIEWYTSDADSAGVHAYIRTLGYTNSSADLIFGTGLGGSADLRLKLGYQGDITFYDTSGNASFVYDESAGSVFNEQGDNKDFRVESDSVANMFFVDASTNRIGINTNAPTTDVDIIGQGTTFADIKLRDAAGRVLEIKSPSDSSEATIATTTNHNLELHAGAGGATNYLTFKTDTVERLEISSGAVIFNDTGADTDFRVESVSNTHMLFVDAGADYINIGSSVRQDNALLQVTGAKSYSGSYVVRNQIIASDTTALSAGVTGGGIGFNGVYNTGGSTTQFGSVEGLKYNGNSGDYGGEVLIRSRRNGGNNEERASFSAAEAVFNEDSHNTDFRVESDGSTHALFVDAGNNRVGVNMSNPAAPFHVAGGTSDTIAAANAIAKISATGLDGLAIGAITSAPFSAYLQSGYTANGYSPEYNNGYPLALNPLNANVVIGGTNVTDSADGLAIQSSSRDNLSIQYLGTSGGHVSGIRFFDFRGQLNARVNNSLINDGVGIAEAHLEFGTAYNGTFYERLSLSRSEAVFNDQSADTDFRVESDSYANMLSVDAGDNNVQVVNARLKFEYDTDPTVDTIRETVVNGKTYRSTYGQGYNAVWAKALYTTISTANRTFPIVSVTRNSGNNRVWVKVTMRAAGAVGNQGNEAVSYALINTDGGDASRTHVGSTTVYGAVPSQAASFTLGWNTTSDPDILEVTTVKVANYVAIVFDIETVQQDGNSAVKFPFSTYGG